MKKVLLSARDPGAALNIYAIYKVLKESSEFDLYLYASRPAFDIITEYGFSPEPFIFECRKNDVFEKNDDFTPLFYKTNKLLNNLKPDIVITGLSSFGAGIDEALIYKSTVKTILYQDFWGDLNPFFGKLPDLVLCLDDFGVNLTHERFGKVECEVVGYPKIELFKDIDISKLRKDTRKLIGAKEDTKVITWFGQSPEIPGHNEALISLIDSFKDSYKNNLILLLRGHPKFKNDIERFYTKSVNLGLNSTNITYCKDSIPWLVSSDLIVTPFSTCGLEHACLSSLSSKPIGSVVYLMNNEKIRSFYFKYTGLNINPLVEKNIGKEINDTFFLEDLIEDQAIRRYYKSAQNKFFDFKINRIFQNINR